jgi:hypothetical protein
MKNIIISVLPVLCLLSACSTGPSTMTPDQAKAANASFLASLTPAKRGNVLFCQDQVQKAVGGTVYIVSIPSMQGGDLVANSSTDSEQDHMDVVYDRVDGDTATSAAMACKIPTGDVPKPAS